MSATKSVFIQNVFSSSSPCSDIPLNSPLTSLTTSPLTHATTENHYPSTDTVTSTVSHPSVTSLRRLSRKLPPALTESLEDLARTSPPSLLQSSNPFNNRPIHLLSASTPNITEFGHYHYHYHYSTTNIPRSSSLVSSKSSFWSSSRFKTKNSLIRRQSSFKSFTSFAISTPESLLSSDSPTQASPSSSSSFAMPIPTTTPQNISSAPRRSSATSSEILVTPPASRFHMPSLSLSRRSIGIGNGNGNGIGITNEIARGSISSASTGTGTSASASASGTSSFPRRSSASASVCGSTSRSRHARSASGMSSTWSIADELDILESVSSSKKGGNRSRSSTTRQGQQETKMSRKERQKREKEEFELESNQIPHAKALFQAGLQEVVDEFGNRIKFQELVKDRRTIVVFIRHWFCPLCAQYMNSILAEVSQESLEEANVDLVIIGNGSDKMLDGYRNKAFRCPFKMYTDPTLSLYRSLGLTRQTGDGGAEEDKGDYLIQTSYESTVQTIKRATKMPLRNPGHFTQLGGEFIFDSSPYSVTFAHRMINTRSHVSIRDLCEKAGVRLKFIHYEPGPPPPPVHRQSYLSALEVENTFNDLNPNVNENDGARAEQGEMESDQSTSSSSSSSSSSRSRSRFTIAGEGAVENGRRPSAISTSSTNYGPNDRDREDWKKDRDDTLNRMRAMKSARRQGLKSIAPATDHQLDGSNNGKTSMTVTEQGKGQGGWTFKDPRSKVIPDKVQIVGKDIAEDEVVLDMSALGYHL